MKYLTLFLLLFLTGCIVPDDSTVSDAAKGPRHIVPVDSFTSFAGRWDALTPDVQYVWCTELAGSWVCQKRQDPPNACTVWPSMNGYSALGGTLNVSGNQINLGNGLDQTFTIANGTINFQPSNVTWGFDVEDASHIVLTYSEGCSIAYTKAE